MKRILLIGLTTIIVLVLAKLIIGQSQTHTAITSVNSNNESTESTKLKTATFAGGCFWCIESTLEKLDGVNEAVSGYSGGTTENPTYVEVGGGKTGHTEAVQVRYNPEIISYEELLYYFLRDIDPTDSKGQFVDRGSEYRPAIFYQNDFEKQLAEKTRDELESSNRFEKPISIEIVPLDKFWKAEQYHQNYHEKSPLRYKVYRTGSGRDSFLKKIWGDDLNLPFPKTTSTDSASHSSQYSKPEEEAIRQSLSEIQFEVTQNDATERPFENPYWNNKEQGIYVDIVSGEPLFSSKDKFKSGTGWPSFSQPIDSTFIVEETDFKLLYPRTEVRSKYGDSHLGHVFKDGPAPTGLRYCVNSAALRFVAQSDLEFQGYNQYSSLFN